MSGSSGDGRDAGPQASANEKAGDGQLQPRPSDGNQQQHQSPEQDQRHIKQPSVIAKYRNQMRIRADPSITTHFSRDKDPDLYELFVGDGATARPESTRFKTE